MYVWVEKSDLELDRVCVNQIHVDCMLGYLSLNYRCVSFLKLKSYCPDCFIVFILSCVSVRRDLQSATLNTLRIAVFHHCKPSREDGVGCKINVFPVFCCYCIAGNFRLLEIYVCERSLKGGEIHIICYNRVIFFRQLVPDPSLSSYQSVFYYLCQERRFCNSWCSCLTVSKISRL